MRFDYTEEMVEKIKHYQSMISIKNLKNHDKGYAQIKTLRKAILKKMRSTDRCGVCNRVGDQYNKLCVHHIDGGKSDHKLKNLIILCRSCHKKVHGRSSNFIRTKEIHPLVIKVEQIRKKFNIQYQLLALCMGITSMTYFRLVTYGGNPKRTVSYKITKWIKWSRSKKLSNQYLEDYREKMSDEDRYGIRYIDKRTFKPLKIAC